jgi:DNA polymerase/3'-5' exonuclease PolX
MSIKFYTAYDRPEKAPFLEKPSEETKVDAVFVPMKKIVETMTEAGLRLAQARKAAYHFGLDEDVPDDFIDLENTPGVEPADVQALAEEVEVRMEDIRKKQQAEATDPGGEDLQQSDSPVHSGDGEATSGDALS